MATTRIKDLSKTATTVASDANIVIDGSSNGTQKITRDNFRQDTADAFVAAPSTYKLAPLNGVNKIDATYLPTSGDTPKGEWNASSNSPALADGSGVAGDYYDVTTAGTQNLGSGSITFTVGDVVKYNGSTWFKIDSVANILDGSATAADGRSTLSVNSKDEDAQANALKTTAPALYFNGTSSLITVADDDKLTFSTLTEFGTTTETTLWSPEDNTPALTDGTGTLNQHYKIDADGTVVQGGSTLSIINGASVTAGQVVYYDGSVWRVKDCDDLPFAVSAFVKMTDASNFTPISKIGTTASLREWVASVSAADKLRLYVQDTAGNYAYRESTTTLTSYEGSWIHLVWVYQGAGPNSSNSFSSSMDGVVLYLNGQPLSLDAAVYFGTYLGMSNTSQPVRIGLQSTTYSKGQIRGVKIFNRSLTATEIAELARGNDLGFADEWANDTELVTNGDFASGANWVAQSDWSIGSGVATTTGVASDYLYAATPVSIVGKRHRLTADFVRTSGSGSIVAEYFDGSFVNIAINSSDASGKLVGEFIAPENGNIYFRATSGWAGTIDNVSVTQIGTLADFRSEDYNESASKLLDRSSNNFVGVGTSVTLTGNQRHISADTIDLKNLPTSSAGLSAGEVWSNSGVLTVV